MRPFCLDSRRRGWALGTTLACLVALTVILFAAISAGVSHLRMVAVATNGQHAQNLAEAALARAVARLVETDYQFGKQVTDRIEISVPGLPGSSGVVTFDPGEFAQGYSKWNLDEDDAKIGARGRSVPGRTVHLVARGRVGSSESWMECVYFKPPFPDGLAATGKIDARALYLAGVRNGQAYSGGDPGTIPPEDTLPGNLVSNSEDPLAARIGPGCRITGSAAAAGGVSVDPDSVVEGEVLPLSEPREIPDMDVRARIDALLPNAVTVTPSGGTLELDPDWFSQAPGGLTVNGDLKLNGSVLLVMGDLQVSGALLGTGVVLVDGGVEITDGRSNVSSAEQVAVACTGDFKLRAAAPEGNYFQGLVYCEGNLEARDITVVGATVVHGQNGAEGSATLDNVRFVQAPGALSMELTRVQGDTISQHSWDWSLTLKPDPQGGEGDFLCDVRAYATDKIFCGEDHNHDLPGVCPMKDVPLVWSGIDEDGDDILATWNSVSGVTTSSIDGGAPTQSQGAAYPNGIPVRIAPDGAIELYGPDGQLDTLSQELFDFFTMVAERFPSDGGEVGKHDEHVLENILKGKVKKAFQDSTYQVTFNLNTLLGESIGSSRVLLWKPFR